jgi:hypothetical protein
MSKKYKYKVFFSAKTEIYELAYQLADNSSERYHNLKLIPELASNLTDYDFEILIKELMQVLDIGAIESTHVRKARFDAALRTKAIVDEFRNLNTSQYLPPNR